MDYGDYLMARMRRVTEAVIPIADTYVSQDETVASIVYVPTTAEGRHEELTWNPPAFLPVYARRFVKATVQTPVATLGWDHSRSC
jgi:hypothetical protein